MLLQILKKLWASEPARFALFTLTGFIIGLAFYPSNDNVKELESRLVEKQTEIVNLKMINEEKMNELQSKHVQIEAMSQEKIRLLESENEKLIKKKKYKKVTITLPDGTRKEEIILITEDTQITEKLKKFEQELFEKHSEEISLLKTKHQQAIKKINESHQKYVNKIREEKQKETTSSKKMGIGVKYSSDESVGGHLHYHVLGNIFVMSGLDILSKNKIRYSLGLGISL
jgi:hypothetical protein